MAPETSNSQHAYMGQVVGISSYYLGLVGLPLFSLFYDTIVSSTSRGVGGVMSDEIEYLRDMSSDVDQNL